MANGLAYLFITALGHVHPFLPLAAAATPAERAPPAVIDICSAERSGCMASAAVAQAQLMQRAAEVERAAPPGAGAPRRRGAAEEARHLERRHLQKRLQLRELHRQAGPQQEGQQSVLRREGRAGEALNGSTGAAEELSREAGSGHAGQVNVSNALDVINSNSARMTPQDAEAEGLLVTTETMAELTGADGEETGCDTGADCFEGDMVVADDHQLELLQSMRTNGSKFVFAGRLWTDANVKYCFASDLPARTKDLVLLAMEQIKHAVPCVRFTDVGNPGSYGSSRSLNRVKACGEVPAVFIQDAGKGSGCWSYIGMIPHTVLHRNNLEAQLLNLEASACTLVGTTVHELFHALGMAHEQSRPDRDDYITIFWENMKSGQEHNFRIHQRGYMGEPYDYLSVMHYGRRAFALHGKDSIGTPDGTSDLKLGQRVGLSQYDANQLDAMYSTLKSGCEATNLSVSAMGCADYSGTDCGSLRVCSTEAAIKECCACGGGVQYRCWSGSECRQVAQLPIVNHSTCVLDKTEYYTKRGYDFPCVVRNKCSYTVRARCKAHRGYYLDLPPGTWNLRDYPGLCQARGGCSFAKSGG